MSEKHEKIRRFQGKLREKSRKSALNILFGRTALTILMLAAQVFLMLGLLLRWQFASFAYGGSYVLGVFMALLRLSLAAGVKAQGQVVPLKAEGILRGGKPAQHGAGCKHHGGKGCLEPSRHLRHAALPLHFISILFSL